MLINAVEVSAETVAELVAQDEARKEQLKRAETSLRDYIEFKEAWLRKPSRKGKVSLQRKELFS